ncbi:hypothetical protein SAMN05444365_10958 [Micromonospora pattaloongensis]|uniref:Uncharacterized protein n=1 Tax=Micromonospora pattaloongensis TaxID=405436 RepID=A0A1H3RSR1_9ACTN|nr:hypothetical protein SAMN05444365_10958 [Micromonospora pattaloongensis]
MFGTLLKRWAVAAVAVPVAAAGARRLSRAIERRRGPSRATNLLRWGADAMQGRARRSRKGPWRGR